MREEVRRGAMKITQECLHIKQNERVLILTDYDIQTVVSDALRDAALSLGAEVSVLAFMPSKGPGKEPSGLAGAAMMQADIIITATSKGIMHSEAITKASNNGARIFTITECTEETLATGAIEADFHALQPVFRKLTKVFKTARQVHITSPGGTDLHFEITGRNAETCSGICREPGCKMGFPDAELYIAPIEYLTNGTIVIDASGTNIGIIKEPITITVKNGNAVSIKGGAQASELVHILASTNEESAYIVSEAAFGLNYKASVVGKIIEDEGVYGTGHFALGNNIHFGGNNKSSIHIDLVYWKPTIELDGEIIMENGKLAEPYLIPELK